MRNRRTFGALLAWFPAVLAASSTFAVQDPPADKPGPEPPAASLTDALDLYRDGSYEEAILAYESLARQPRTAKEAGLGLARCRLQIGEYDEALAGLIALDAMSDSGWHALLAEVYRTIGRYDQAATHAREALKIAPDDAGARRLLGELLDLVGRRNEAIEGYRWFDRQVVERGELPRDAAWLTHAAVGFVRFSVLTKTNVADRTRHALNEMLQPAYERIDRTYWPARVAAADLLRERYNNDEEHGSLSDYLAALRLNKNLPQAQVGIGEVALDAWNFEEVERRAEAALKINPRYAPAIHLLAKKFVVERRYPQAIETCERALAINPNDLTALSVQAAASACLFDEEAVKQTAERVAKINPTCALLHRTLGDALGGIRQYADSQREYLKAIELDPTDANARTELGMMYMQWGLEAKARDVLEAAWALDAFNERTKFTLELLEMIEKLAQVETPHFIVKYDPGTDPGLGDFTARYMESIYGAVTGDYDCPLKDKTIIEWFPTHRAFGVRITGKPWIHTVGASTGMVIALSSPKDSTQFGHYNIARVLKHEFTHTVTLDATHNRIPHWFTEGLAVAQEDAPPAFEWRVMLADAARRDRLFTLESIDWGFMRPKRPTDRQLAYAQSEWMCEYIIERFGYDAINAMIRRYRDGEKQPKVMVEQLGVEQAAFDQDFRAWARKQVTEWGFDLTPPDDVAKLREEASADGASASLLARLARAEYDEENHEAALAAARRAVELDPRERMGLTVLGETLWLRARAERRDADRRPFDDEAQPAMTRLLDVDPKSWIAPKLLAEIAVRRDELDRAIEMYQRLQRVCPFDPASWRGLAGIYLQRGDDASALPQLLEVARLTDNDPDIPAGIAAIHRRGGRLREAIYWLRQALYIDPFSVKLQEVLGDTCLQTGDTHAALEAYAMLTKLEPGKAAHFEKAAAAAHKLGDAAAAQAFAKRAVEIDPASSARSLLP